MNNRHLWGSVALAAVFLLVWMIPTQPTPMKPPPTPAPIVRPPPPEPDYYAEHGPFARYRRMEFRAVKLCGKSAIKKIDRKRIFEVLSTPQVSNKGNVFRISGAFNRWTVERYACEIHYTGSPTGPVEDDKWEIRSVQIVLPPGY